MRSGIFRVWMLCLFLLVGWMMPVGSLAQMRSPRGEKIPPAPKTGGELPEARRKDRQGLDAQLNDVRNSAEQQNQQMRNSKTSNSEEENAQRKKQSKSGSSPATSGKGIPLDDKL